MKCFVCVYNQNTKSYNLQNIVEFMSRSPKESANKWDRNRKAGAIRAYKEGRVSANWVKSIAGYVPEKD